MIDARDAGPRPGPGRGVAAPRRSTAPPAVAMQPGFRAAAMWSPRVPVKAVAAPSIDGAAGNRGDGPRGRRPWRCNQVPGPPR